MNNSESYPGWKNVANIRTDITAGANGTLRSYTRYMSNIFAESKNTIRINTNGSGAILFLGTEYYSYTQSQWQEHYPNTILELYYQIVQETAQYEEPITQEEVINQLNAIYNALSYNKETNIIIESSNAQMIASVSVVEGE